MVTANTPLQDRLRPLALETLLGQIDAPPFELVIVMPEGDSLKIGEAKAVVESKVPRKIIRGNWEHITDKQNAGVAATEGEWVTLWDDCDWSEPRRLAKVAIWFNQVSLVGSMRIVHHELATAARNTVEFTSRAGLVDRTAAFHRDLWEEDPFVKKLRFFDKADLGNVGEWLRVRAQWSEPATVELDYVQMMPGAGFRIDPSTGAVFDGDEFRLLGGRGYASTIVGEAMLKRYEGAGRCLASD